jgi:outer membrane protein OmpA-like peptidoglycan-associated protein
MQRGALVIAAITVVGLAGSGCATKGFVRNSVGEVDTRVGTLEQSLEATQQQTKENASRITQVDQKADQAGTAAKTAQTSAVQAQGSADKAAARAAAVETASKRLIFQVVVSDEQGNFKAGQSELPPDVRTKLDELANKLKADPAGNYIEIEGHTDAQGSPESNAKLGLARAEAAKRYLYETYQIPLHKINVISFGEEKPVAPNNTREGRAQNRRVVIKVLA